jgi:Uma2 family endonuclease
MAMVVQDEVVGEIRIPEGITNLTAFRRWATSDIFPARGRFSFLAGELHVDLFREEAFTQNLLRSAILCVIGQIIRDDDRGYLFSSRVLFSNVEADLATEPELMLVSFEALRSKRVRFTKKEMDCIEVVGTPDMVMEIIGDSSQDRDRIVLRELYWKAGIPEYWLIDARDDKLRFDLLAWTTTGYKAVRRANGCWLKSNVLGQMFRLEQQSDPLGYPQHTLHVKG